MPVETVQSIASLAAGAGFTGSQVAIATALALAESDGNTNSVGDNGTSFGLWQIHVPAHPEFKGVNLFDPATNARAAYTVYQHQGWGAWSTYNGARYFKYLPAAQAASGGATLAKAGPIDPAGIARDTVGSATDAVQGGVASAEAALQQAAGITGFLANLADPAIWTRALKVLIGGAAILVGVGLVVKMASDETGATGVIKSGAKIAATAAAA